MKTKNSSKDLKVKFSSNFVKMCLSLLILCSFIVIMYSHLTNADPAGASITSNVTESSPVYSPGSLTNPGGTINTVVLDVVQQNDKWKAYVGNISGALTLDDGDGYTIFQWAMGASEVAGEVYASRANSIDWSVINCSNVTLIDTEDSVIGFSGSSLDNINNTFNETTHNAIVTAGRTMVANSCRATATFVNDTKQNQSSAFFQEVLFASGNDLIYTSPLNQGTAAFNYNSTVDFQFIVADDVTQAITTYYFYVEIGG